MTPGALRKIVFFSGSEEAGSFSSTGKETEPGSMGIVSPAEPSPGRMTSSLDCFPSRMVVSIPVLAPARPGYWDAEVTVRVVGSKTDSEVRRTPDLCDVSWWTPVILPRSTGSSSPNQMRESSETA